MVNLFCLPFAGGNKYSYRIYEKNATSWIRFIPLEYPGRGERIREVLLTDMEQVVDDIYEQLMRRMDDNVYAIYGHSMGAFVALLLTRKITDAGQRLPVHLFLTGTTGPVAYVKDRKQRHQLSKDAFLQDIIDLEGCPEEVLQHPELLNYFEPILRADFQVAETYNYETHAALDIPFTVITGTDEKITDEDISTWQQETTHTVDFRKMPGNHFFILNNSEKIISLITNKLFKSNKTAGYDRKEDVSKT